MSNRLPKLIAFDLDYTLWDFYVDFHLYPPLKQDESGAVTDSNGQDIAFYKDVPKILHRLRDAGVAIAACSRTSDPKLAMEALRLIQVLPKAGDKQGESNAAIDFFDQLEIYPTSKEVHFKALHEKTGIPYSEMLFFDDEIRNKNVDTKLGVTFILVKKGLDERTMENGLKEWRTRHPVEATETDS
ncbi:magnesium-dependent phosphatase-1 [Hygrophoropsis aurantiaca]|uniref:Magnesium-dependent phosphatase-1 n=1 Tax=Hygrophoropsis aurantiaca TaxID=72124 RepID=A0ACB8ANP6_9AGAM|nr:magnesium-dependent phosphatase-1 [Hygrophoropsis aurantiaca]